MNILTQWYSMDTGKQLSWLKACTLRIVPLEVTHGTPEWFVQYHDLDGLADEGWAHIAEITPEALDKLNAKRETPITLASVVWRAARHAVRTAGAADVKHAHEDLDEWLCVDGNEPTAHDYTPEEYLLYRAWLDDFTAGMDETDKQIVDGRLRGLKQNEIARNAGISAPAICRRVKHIRERAVA